MKARVFIEQHLTPQVSDLFKQADLACRFRQPRQGADLEIHVGEARFLVGVLLSRSGVHFREKIDRLKSMAAGKRAKPLLAAPSLSPQRQDLLRKQGISFLDLIGNVWINAPGILIDRQSKGRDGVRMREVNSPFSDKSSLVLRLMMDDPGRHWGNNEIARKAGINAGWVSQVCRRLEELRYALRSENRKLRIFRPQDVLEDWVEYYKQRKQKMHYFRLPQENPRRIMEAIKECRSLKRFGGLFSFHAGASLLAPYVDFQAVHIYSEGLPASIEHWKKDIGFEETAPSDSNLILIEPYYAASCRHGMLEVDGFPVASEVQLYLDLRTSPIRGEEQAAQVFEKRIAPRWGGEGANG